MPKTIDDIIPPSRRRAMENEQQNKPSEPTPFQAPPPPPPSNTSPMSPMPPSSQPPRMYIRTERRFPYVTAIIAVLVIALSAVALYAFSGAKVEITPATQSANVNGSFTAAANGDLPYSVISLSKTQSVSVPAESTESANDSAQGTITISNAQTIAEKLITNTRFQSASGLIYRVHTPITIPAGSATEPGTLVVTVYADQPGQQYNIGPTTFTVPGLQGSNAFTLVTAKSSAPMAGGFTGTRASVSQSTDDSQHSALQQTLSDSLQSALLQKVPSGYVLVPGATFTTFSSLPDSATTTSTVYLTEQADVSAIIFPETALAKAIAYQTVGTYSGEPVTLDGVTKLNLTPSTSTSASSTDISTALQSAGTFAFTLSGTTNIIWTVDTSKIAGAVAGKTRDSAQQILSGFPEVDHAVLILRPFWATTFPEDPSHIQVTVTPPATGS